MLRPGRRGESGGLLHADVHCSAWRLVVLGHLVSQVKEKCKSKKSALTFKFTMVAVGPCLFYSFQVWALGVCLAQAVSVSSTGKYQGVCFSRFDAFDNGRNTKVSMAKERKRLINEDMVQDQPTTIPARVGQSSRTPGRDNMGQEEVVV